jgi:hypothetical protein
VKTRLAALKQQVAPSRQQTVSTMPATIEAEKKSPEFTAVNPSALSSFAPVIPTIEANLSMMEDWLRCVGQLKQGLVRQLAEHIELTREELTVQGKRWHGVVSSAQWHLTTSSTRIKLEEMLTAQQGVKIALILSEGVAQGVTFAAQRQQQQHEQQEDAQRAIMSDAVVQEMMHHLGATVVAGSVRATPI